MLDQAFEALKTYDWGADRKALNPIDEAINTTHGDAAARKELEAKLLAVLTSDAPRDAKDFVCRKLMRIGSAASVGSLAELLSKKDHSHMARYALERIPAPEAAKAMRDALSSVSAELKVGIISSLGTRQDEASVATLGKLIGDQDVAVARAAAHALGAIRSPAAANALTGSKPSDDAQSATTDASFACAEALLSDGKQTEALSVYKGLAGADQPKHVRLAATRGMLACAGKKE